MQILLITKVFSSDCWKHISLNQIRRVCWLGGRRTLEEIAKKKSGRRGKAPATIKGGVKEVNTKKALSLKQTLNIMHREAREFLMINFYRIIRKGNEWSFECLLQLSNAQADFVILEVFLRILRCKNDRFLPLIHEYDEIFFHYHLSY